MSEFTITAKRQGTKYAVVAANGQPVHADLISLAKHSDREKFIATVAEKVNGIDADAIRAELLNLVAAEAAKESTPEPATPSAPDAEALLSAMPEEVKAEARRMLEAPDLIKRVTDDIAALGVAGEQKLAATVYMVLTSRLLEKPLAAITQGQSSSGKSYTTERTAELFPAESVIHAKQMTPQALFHMKPGALEHKGIVGGERSRAEGDEAAEATRALREMISSGVLTKLIPEKQADGSIVTKQIFQKGPIAFIESTTMTNIFAEDANRCLLLQTDEREAQTRRILKMAAERRSGGASGCNVQNIIDKHHAAQRMLRNGSVVIPFAHNIADKFPSDRTEARRAFGQLMSMVESVACLHQLQRKLDHEGRIVAQAEDYVLAKLLLDSPMARMLGRRISDAALRFYDRLARAFPGFEVFTTRDAGKLSKASDQAVRGWLRELSDAGYLECVEAAKGPKPATWKLSDAPPTDEGTAALPDVSVIQ